MGKGIELRCPLCEWCEPMLIPFAQRPVPQGRTLRMELDTGPLVEHLRAQHAEAVSRRG